MEELATKKRAPVESKTIWRRTGSPTGASTAGTESSRRKTERERLEAVAGWIESVSGAECESEPLTACAVRVKCPVAALGAAAKITDKDRPATTENGMGGELDTKRNSRNIDF